MYQIHEKLPSCTEICGDASAGGKESRGSKKEALLYLLRKVPCEEAAAGSARPSTVLQLADDKSSVVLEDLT